MGLFKKIKPLQTWSIEKIRKSMPEDIYNAHKFSSKHKSELENDKICGCFYCLKIYNSNEFKNG